MSGKAVGPRSQQDGDENRTSRVLKSLTGFAEPRGRGRDFSLYSGSESFQVENVCVEENLWFCELKLYEESLCESWDFKTQSLRFCFSSVFRRVLKS